MFSGGCDGGSIREMLIREKEPARVERAAEIPRAAVAMSRIEGEAAARYSKVAKQL